MKIIATSLAHDSSICYLEDGRIKYWNKQERLSRIKRQGMPFKPLLEIERNFDLSGLDFYISSSPYQQMEPPGPIDDVMYFNWYAAPDPFRFYFPSVHPTCKVYLLNTHHLAHAANAFYGSGFDHAFVLVVDRSGSVMFDKANRTAVGVETETLYYCRYPCQFDVVYRNPPHWIGITGLYSLVSVKLGLGVQENGKTMGLAAYGKNVEGAQWLRNYLPTHPKTCGSVTNGTALCDMLECDDLRLKLIEDQFANARNEDLARQMQDESSNAILQLIKERVDPGVCKNLCFTGGHAHNCLLNYKIANEFPHLNFYADPIPDDAGNSLGAAKFWWFQQSQSTTKMPLENICDAGL
jgi:carbamoyltransferase